MLILKGETNWEGQKSKVTAAVKNIDINQMKYIIIQACPGIQWTPSVLKKLIENDLSLGHPISNFSD